MNYYEAAREHFLTNLVSQLKTPTLVRVDINVPAPRGRIMESSFRLRIYSHILELMSEYAGLVVLSHQGRPGQEDFIPLKQHWIVLRKLLPMDIEVEFIPAEKVFTSKTIEKIKRLEKKQIILIDNVRMFKNEFEFNPKNSIYISFFKGVVKTCVNDAIPTWHRSNSSLMALPYIAKTFIGLRSAYELKVMSEVLGEGASCGIILGGAKLAKLSYLINILKRMEGFLGGLPGQLVARVKGYDLGLRNNEFLEKKMSKEQFEAAKLLVKKFKVHHPVDFVVFEKGERRNVSINELKKHNGLIMDIGEETVEKYSLLLQEKDLRIRAGPLGVYEQGYSNGVVLTKRIAGSGLIFVGGDTSQEISQYGLDQVILDTGGVLLVSGGSFLHGLAGFNFPSLDLIISKGSR